MGQRNLRLNRIDDFEEGKSVEISIPGAYPPDSVLTHEDCRVRVMDEIACKVRKLSDDLPCNLGVPLRGDNEIEPWRGNECGDEQPCFGYAP